MSDVTGPISTLPGTTRDVPDGMMCDYHPDQPAVVRVQGETDSFGCEMEDICQQCVDERKAYRCSEAGQAEELEWRTGACEWCKNHATDLRDARDYEEGMCGRVYRVCGACIKRVNDEAQAELDAMGYYDDYADDPDDYDNPCGYCDDTGDVHSIDGEWRGYCTCPEGLRLKGECEARYRAKSASPSPTQSEETP